eukprot:12433625-Ditylum_brightwellii.AAC.1
MFVDDNTLMHNTNNFDEPATNLMQQVKYDTKYWGRLLWITRGLLEFLKSSYFIVVWTFTTERKLEISSELPENTVQLTDTQVWTTKLRQISPNNRIEMLGIRKAATLKEKSEIGYLHKKIS